jgi:hypothetical protein
MNFVIVLVWDHNGNISGRDGVTVSAGLYITWNYNTKYAGYSHRVKCKMTERAINAVCDLACEQNETDITDTSHVVMMS